VLCALFTAPLSFSNYGGIPVKAEYCHEAVCEDDVLGDSWIDSFNVGSTARPSHNINVSCSIRVLYSAIAVPLHRFLRPFVCADKVRTDRGEKGRSVYFYFLSQIPLFDN
jgi:hypothetical protein